MPSLHARAELLLRQSPDRAASAKRPFEGSDLVFRGAVVAGEFPSPPRDSLKEALEFEAWQTDVLLLLGVLRCVLASREFYLVGRDTLLTPILPNTTAAAEQ